jgi:hypothetical protein
MGAFAAAAVPSCFTGAAGYAVSAEMRSGSGADVPSQAPRWKWVISASSLAKMIGLAESHPYFLTEPEERSGQQNNGDREQKTGSVFMPQLEKCTYKPRDQERCRAQRARKSQIYRTVQKQSPLPLSRDVGLEVNSTVILGSNFIQAADSFYNIIYSAEQHGDEGGYRAENKRRRGSLRHEPRKLRGIRNEVHLGVPAFVGRVTALHSSRSNSMLFHSDWVSINL